MSHESRLSEDLVIAYHILSAKVVRRYRRVRRNRSQIVVYLAVVCFFLLVGIGLFIASFIAGRMTQDGTTFPVANAFRNMILPMVLGYALFAFLSSTGQMEEKRADPLLQTSVSERSRLLAHLGDGLQSQGILPFVTLVIVGSGYALGAGTPIVALTVLLAGLPLVVLGYLVGQCLVYGFWIVLLTLPVSSAVRHLLQAVGFVALLLLSIAFGIGLETAADAGIASAVPTGLPLTPFGYYADLFFVGTPLSTPIELPTLVAAALCLGAILLVGGLTFRLIPYFWDTVPNDPSRGADREDDDSRDSDRVSPTIGLGYRLERFRTVRIAMRYFRRVRRSPDRLTFLLYYVLLTVFIGVIGFFTDSLTAFGSVGLSLIYFGTWLSGAAFCLNPIGDEENMHSQLLLVETPASVFINARLVLGVSIGSAVALIGVAVFSAALSLTPPVVAVTAVVVSLLVVASAGAALGIGSAAPQFGTASILGATESVSPSLGARLFHGILSSILVLVALNGSNLVVLATWLGPVWARILLLFGMACVFLAVAETGRRYATKQFVTVVRS